MISKRKSCYCAFCKTTRKVYSNKHLQPIEVLAITLLSVVITYALFFSLDMRGLYILGLTLFIAEVFSQLKWRSSMICRNCGFDPVVYVRNPEQAGLRIKAFIEKRSVSADYLLRDPVILPLKKNKKGENLHLKI